MLVARGEAVPDTAAGPIVVCTRNDDLEGVIAATPKDRRKGVGAAHLPLSGVTLPLLLAESELGASADLVFIQNGMLQPWLDQEGLGDTTQVGYLWRPPPHACVVHMQASGLRRRFPDSRAGQVLVYFAVAKKGEMPTDGKTDLNPEGLTAAHGVHAESIARLLHSNGLSCSLPSRPDFVKAMLEKLVWIR